jgi:hypothetical protein
MRSRDAKQWFVSWTLIGPVLAGVVYRSDGGKVSCRDFLGELALRVEMVRGG